MYYLSEYLDIRNIIKRMQIFDLFKTKINEDKIKKVLENLQKSGFKSNLRLKDIPESLTSITNFEKLGKSSPYKIEPENKEFIELFTPNFSNDVITKKYNGSKKKLFFEKEKIHHKDLS